MAILDEPERVRQKLTKLRDTVQKYDDRTHDGREHMRNLYVMQQLDNILNNVEVLD